MEGILNWILKKIWKVIVACNCVMLAFAIFGVATEILRHKMSGEGLGFCRLFTDLSQGGLIIMYWCIWWVFPISVLIIDHGLERRCSTCKKWFALRWDRNELIKSEDISILAELKTKNKMGEVIGTQEQYVPGTRKTYNKIYRCRKCGAVSYKTYSEDTKNV